MHPYKSLHIPSFTGKLRGVNYGKENRRYHTDPTKIGYELHN